MTRLVALSCICAALLGCVACAGGEEGTRSDAAATSAPQPPQIGAAARRQPSYRLFAAWLAASNSGDRERYATFLEERFPFRPSSIEEDMDFRRTTGGFELRKVERLSSTQITGWMQERDSDQFAEFMLTVELDLGTVSSKPRAAEPLRIADLELRAIPRPAEFPIAQVTDEEAIAGVEKLLQKSVASDRFSGAVLVAKNGEVLFGKAYGLADRGRGIANGLQTRFRVGSMNKMFTAVAILQLVEAGKVELDAPLARYLPDYPNKDVAWRVRIEHLLTHTGGTGDIFGPEFYARRNDLRTHSDYLELYGKRDLEFAPGSTWAYSNYGFVLLGAVIEHVTGQSYYKYVQTNILEPAGMMRTGSLPERRAVPGLSIGYTKAPGTASWKPNTDTLPYRGTAAGGGYSTVEDLARFADALLDHELLSEDSTQLLLTGRVASWPGSRYAYGFDDARDADGNGWVGHGGGAPGMNGDLRIFPKSGYVVAVLANMDPPAALRISDYLAARMPTDR